ncbi:AP-4 complex subunit beta-1-like [Glandiceps talaboti]
MAYFSSGSISDIHELRSQLRNPTVQSDQTQCQQIVRRIVVLMTQGIDMSELFTDMVKASATQDIVQKKLIYLYMSSYAEMNPDLSLLAVNTLCKDCSDPNPMVRGLALRTMCSLRLPNLVEYTERPLLDGLQDKSAYVRRTAVIGCVKLWHIAPSFIIENGIVDQLYSMLRDKDTIVVVNCLTVLDEVLDKDGGVVINKSIAHYLLNRLYEFPDWGQSKILQLLLKYKVENEDEAYDIMNIVDICLKHSNSGVSSNAIKLLLVVTKDMKDIQIDVCKRIKGSLLNMLSSNSSELCFTSLHHIQLLIQMNRAPKLFSSNYKKFYCRYNDVSYVKFMKIELLTLVCNEENIKDIVNELSAYCTDVSVSIARKSIQALGDIVQTRPECSTLCMERLVGLLDLQLDYVTSQVLITLQGLLLLERNQSFINPVVTQLPNCVELVHDSAGKTAMVWLIGHYGQALPDSPYILEDLIDNIEEEFCNLLKLHLIVATTKLFFSRPAECQDMLGKLLEHCIEIETSVEVKERAMMYYRLLSQDVTKAKEIICSSQSVIPEMNKEDASNEEENIEHFNSLAVLIGTAKWNEIKARQKQSDIDSYKRNEIKEVKTTKPLVKGQTGHLLNLDEEEDAKGDDESTVAMAIQLKDDFTLTPSNFEASWTRLTTSDSWEFNKVSSMQCSVIEEKLNGLCIKTMATSPYENDPWRAFFYAQDMKLTMYLLEVVVHQQKNHVVVTVKYDVLEDTEAELQSLRSVCQTVLTK